MTGVDGRAPESVAKVMPLLRLAMKGYFRSEVRDMNRLPEGGVLIVSNHSGGLLPMDVPIIAVGIADEFGHDRPLYCLSHDILFIGPLGGIMRKYGMIRATRENAREVLTSGGATIVFPGGDYDCLREQSKANVIDFGGRTGYVRTAIETGVPILPVVSIGGHEDQFHLTRGEWIARFSPVSRALRMPYFPISFGFPFGFTPAFPINLPLPSKITTQVLDPVDIIAEFGPDPDVAEVDVEIRSRMQDALDVLAGQRRFPVLG
ncbi:1-acyl-sn-glycerol-3-phosphate acyltransferase [Aeromicrobium sp.]|uniref:1-acyl-sn-glycerol-3-phosphate acyltransferase n=1 Tax=Aeromicrobium sp. TaxID=1871063 RepID=UPI0030C22AE6